MAGIPQDNPRLLRAIADFEKELAKANNLLKENSGILRQSFSSLNEKARIMEEIFLTDETAKRTLENFIASKKTLVFYGQLSAALAALKKALSDFEEQSLKTEVFLESFRRERSYDFETEQAAMNFISQLFSLYSIEAVSFRPQFLGVLDLKELSEKLGLKKAKQQLLVEILRLPALMDFLKRKNAAHDFVLESAEIRLFIKNPLQVRIEAENAKIKRLDRLAKELGAKLE